MIRNLVEGRPFESFIMSVIFANTVIWWEIPPHAILNGLLQVVLAMFKPGQPTTFAEDTVQNICTAIFLIEAVLKIYAYGFPAYIDVYWNRLDFTVVCSSVVSIILVRCRELFLNHLHDTPCFTRASYRKLGRVSTRVFCDSSACYARCGLFASFQCVSQSPAISSHL